MTTMKEKCTLEKEWVGCQFLWAKGLAANGFLTQVPACQWIDDKMIRCAVSCLQDKLKLNIVIIYTP